MCAVRWPPRPRSPLACDVICTAGVAGEGCACTVPAPTTRRLDLDGGVDSVTTSLLNSNRSPGATVVALLPAAEEH